LQQVIDTVPHVVEFKKRFKPFVEDDFPSLLLESEEKANAVIAHPYASQF